MAIGRPKCHPRGRDMEAAASGQGFPLTLLISKHLLQACIVISFGHAVSCIVYSYEVLSTGNTELPSVRMNVKSKSTSRGIQSKT